MFTLNRTLLSSQCDEPTIQSVCVYIYVYYIDIYLFMYILYLYAIMRRHRYVESNCASVDTCMRPNGGWLLRASESAALIVKGEVLAGPPRWPESILVSQNANKVDQEGTACQYYTIRWSMLSRHTTEPHPHQPETASLHSANWALNKGRHSGGHLIAVFHTSGCRACEWTQGPATEASFRTLQASSLLG